MRNITDCCKGYKKAQKTPLICKPYCSKRIEQGTCIGPNEYICLDGYNLIEGPDLIKCIPQCDNCKHGYCIGPNLCKCGQGYQNGIDPGTCDPVCNSGCPNGKCTHPEVCECNEGQLKFYSKLSHLISWQIIKSFSKNL